MAYTAVTYSFSAGSTAKASEVNANFTDIINGLSDGTKDLSVKNITMAAAAVLTMTATSYVSGQVGLGISTPDAGCKLHAWGGTAGAVTAANTSILVAESSGDCAISLLNPAANTGIIYFGTPTSATNNKLTMSGAGTFGIYTAGTLRYRVDSTSAIYDVGIALGLGGSPASALHIYSAAGGAGFGYITLEEVAAPGAPAADSAALYLDNGGVGGKTRLMCRFQSGAAQAVALEP